MGDLGDKPGVWAGYRPCLLVGAWEEMRSERRCGPDEVGQ